MPAIWLNNFLSWVKPRRVWINDSGSWVSARNVYVNNSGTWHRVFTRGLWTTITSGTDGNTTGYNRQFSPIPPHMGSATEITLVDGKTLTFITYNATGGGFGVAIAGFSSDPGAGYLHSIVIPGWGSVEVGDSQYLSYTYGTAAQWSWLVGSSPFTNGVSTFLEIYTS